MLSQKSLAIGLILGLVIGLPMGYFVLPNLLQSINNGYTKVQVVAEQGASVTFGDYVYAFAYISKGTISVTEEPTFTVSTPAFLIPNKVYPAVVGAVYNVSGIEIVVSEVHDNYIILLVKSTVP